MMFDVYLLIITIRKPCGQHSFDLGWLSVSPWVAAAAATDLAFILLAHTS
jgi:hypothetical protein